MLSNASIMGNDDIVTCGHLVDDSVVLLVISYGLVVACFLYCCMMLMTFCSRLRDIMIRQRAPWITIIQAVAYLLQILIFLAIELLLRAKVLDWDHPNGSSQGDSSPSESQIPFSRKFFKVAWGLCRVTIATAIPYRLTVIWAQLKTHDMSIVDRSFKRSFFTNLTHPQKSAALLIFLNVVLYLLLFPKPGHLITMVPAFDWYNESNCFRNQYFQLDSVFILELSLATAAIYVVRSFPDDINIVAEYACLLCVGFVTEIFYQCLIFFQKQLGSESEFLRCAIFGLRTDFVVDLSRCMGFFFILTYFSNMSSSRRRASTPFLHKIEDFCVIQRNRHYFMKFLHTISPDLVEELNNSLVNLTNGKTVRGSTCFSPALEKQFQYFTRTKSFKTLEEMNEQTEIIMARGYEF